MLYSRSKNEWDEAFHNARSLVINNHNLVEKLTKIHKDPSHYAGYYLSSVKGGSLGKHGDSHSEQNHSSVVAYLGQGGSLAIQEQIQALLKRHKNRIQQKNIP